MKNQTDLGVQVEQKLKRGDFYSSTRKLEPAWLRAFLYYRDAIAPLYGEESRRQPHIKGERLASIRLSSTALSGHQVARVTIP